MGGVAHVYGGQLACTVATAYSARLHHQLGFSPSSLLLENARNHKEAREGRENSEKMPPKKTRGIKRRKPRNGNYLQMPQNMNIPSPAPKTDIFATLSHSSAVPVTNVGRMDPKVQQAKQFAVAQAQQDGCVGNFRSFSSQFGNYLVPVIPTLADLNS